MSGELLEQLEDDAENVFLTDFDETIVYSPKDGRLPPRSIQAIVDREMPQNPGGVQRGATDRLRIVVINSATDGISSAELNLGGDVITVCTDLSASGILIAFAFSREMVVTSSTVSPAREHPRPV